MKSFSPPNLLSRSLIGAVGLGVALLGLPQSVKAFTVNRGTDYVATPSGGAVFTFVDPQLGPDPVTVNFKGLAIGTPTATPPDGGYSGEADTVINRLQDVNGTPTGGTTPIEIVGLSLKSVDPVFFNGANYDVFAGLQKYYNGTTSTGTMTIRHENSDSAPTQGTWDSSFTIKGVAIVATAGTLIPTGTDYVKGLIQGCTTATNYQCLLFDKGPFATSNQPWSHDPSLGQIQGSNLVQPGLEQNFYLTGITIHDAGGGIIHNVQPQPVPEPLTILGSLAALGFGAAFEKKRGKKSKKDQQD
jgi:hypothetical protein